MIVLRLSLFFMLFAGLLFGCAGRIDLPFFWAYVGIHVFGLCAGMALMDPGLVKERIKPGAGGVDRNLRAAIMPCFLALLIVAGLDVRRGWSSVPISLQVAGLTALAFAFALILWATRTNRFFSPVVRIQSERGHHLITGGPYRWIRHPGYAGALLMLPAGALALGSWWALIPLLPATVLLVRRILIEDRFLHEQLEGYAEYAARVRFRILPGVW